jgi:manganese-dependent inorganic pyrophosphatase
MYIYFTMIKVFGHISPDSDATGSAILWAWHLNINKSQPATPYVLGALNKETQFVLSKWGVPAPELLSSVEKGDDVFIVDTNNPQELFPNINDTNIVGILDHHKLFGGLLTAGPIDVTIQAVASTASVIYSAMGEARENLPKEIAGIMLSCILSDTLAFRSPTTTAHDKAIAEKLAKQLGLDIQSYANEMFKAKSDVSDFSDDALLHLDSKKFEVGDKNVRISVVETTDPASILTRKDGLVSAIKEILSKESDIHDVLVFIIDIFKEEATVLTYNQFTRDVISASFGVTVSGDTQILPGIVSRKKQIVPVLKLPN